MLRITFIETDTIDLLPSLCVGRFLWKEDSGRYTSHHFMQFSFITLGINLDIERDVTHRVRQP